MIAELKTLFWLQWRLTMAMFRRKDAQGIARLLQQALLVLQLLFTFPTFVLMGVGLAVGLALITPRAAFEAVVILNTFLMFVWLLMPTSYSGQLIERFEMSQLFPHPISFRALVVGSTLMSLLSATGLWTLPLLLGEIVGLTFHAPLAFPLILLGALPVFALLVLTGRLMDDLFDLVAGDRRLRAAMIFVLMLPFMVLGFGQYILQYLTNNYESMDQLVERLLGAGVIQRLEEARNFSQFLEALNLSRLLLWLPPGWASAGMALPGSGEWGRGLIYLGAALLFGAGMLLLHAGITKRLMQGAALSIGAERVRSSSWRVSLPGSPVFWALFRKDWLHLFRNPMPKRMLLSAPFMVFPILVMLRSDVDSQIPFVQEKMPFLIVCFFMALIFFMMNASLTANYFGTIDREGLATLSLTPLDRRWVLLSANLAMLALAAVAYLFLGAAVVIVTGRWALAPLALLMAFCLQVSCAPAFNLAAIMGPYRTQLKMQGRQRGNLWGFLGALASPPVLLLFLVPYAFWTPGLWITVPLAVIYSVGAYWLTLRPLAEQLQKREHAILSAVSAGD
jgi:hypothetical protein